MLDGISLKYLITLSIILNGLNRKLKSVQNCLKLLMKSKPNLKINPKNLAVFLIFAFLYEFDENKLYI